MSGYPKRQECIIPTLGVFKGVWEWLNDRAFPHAARIHHFPSWELHRVSHNVQRQERSFPLWERRHGVSEWLNDQAPS